MHVCITDTRINDVIGSVEQVYARNLLWLVCFQRGGTVINCIRPVLATHTQHRCVNWTSMLWFAYLISDALVMYKANNILRLSGTLSPSVSLYSVSYTHLDVYKRQALIVVHYSDYTTLSFIRN